MLGDGTTKVNFQSGEACLCNWVDEAVKAGCAEIECDVEEAILVLLERVARAGRAVEVAVCHLVTDVVADVKVSVRIKVE